jgi:hypothetical protein
MAVRSWYLHGWNMTITRRELLGSAAVAVAGSRIALPADSAAEPKGLTFVEALYELRKKHRYIQRPHWGQRHVAWLRHTEYIDTFYGAKPGGFIYQVRDSFMKPCENIFINREDKIANDWRLIESGEIKVTGEFDGMTLENALVALSQGYCIQRAGWGARHDSPIDINCKIMMLNPLVEATGTPYATASEEDRAAWDWRTVTQVELRNADQNEWLRRAGYFEIGDWYKERLRNNGQVTSSDRRVV